MGSKRREEQPLGEEHNPEGPNQETYPPGTTTATSLVGVYQW